MLHLLTDICDEMESIKNILSEDSSSLDVSQIDTVEEFKKFDSSLSDKEAKKNIVRNNTLLKHKSKALNKK